jgi:hypothetical protein
MADRTRADQPSAPRAFQAGDSSRPSCSI